MSQSKVWIGVVLLTALVMAVCVLLVPKMILDASCDRDSDRDALDSQIDFYCPVGSKVVYAAWSECGLMKVCLDSRNKRNGSLFAAQGGQLQTKTLYFQGRALRSRTWYDREGKAHIEGSGYQDPNKH